MRITVRSLPVVLALAIVAGLVPANVAHAAITPTPMGGRAWSVPVIRLYDTTPRLYREGIDIAIREWNRASVGIKFARTSERRRAHVVIKAVSYPGSTAGMALLGEASNSYVGLDTALVAVAPVQRGNVILDLPGFAVPEEIAGVMAHELGHVIGLKHTSGCSLMGPSGATACGNRFQEGRWACRMIQRKDLIAAARRYGGVGLLKRQRYCPRSTTKAGTVGTVKVAQMTMQVATALEWREVTNGFGFVIARSTSGGGCPTTPDAGSMRKDLDFPEFEERWDAGTIPTAAGRYCYSIWSQNGRGTLTGPKRVFVDLNPPVHAPVSNLQASVSGSTVSLTWTNPPTPGRVRLERYAANGTCAAPEDATYVPVVGTSDTLAYAPPGTWTFVATRNDEASSESGAPSAFASSPVCVDVTVVSPPPEEFVE